jgi:endonuclease-3
LSIEAKRDYVVNVIGILQKATKSMPDPAAIAIVKEYGKNPFLILISCLLSLRARDTASLPASKRLFKLAMTPKQLIDLPLHEIEKQIYSVGYYRSKAKQLKSVCSELLERFNGIVPSTYEELTSIKGVGPKTANLVLGEAFGKQALYVDIHVHRISNRLGFITTTTVEETQRELERIVPKQYWNEYSRLLVTWGQNICVPISPFCSKCPLYNLCKRVGVTRQR